MVSFSRFDYTASAYVNRTASADVSRTASVDVSRTASADVSCTASTVGKCYALSNAITRPYFRTVYCRRLGGFLYQQSHFFKATAMLGTGRDDIYASCVYA